MNEKPLIFKNCNVCGRQLIREDEFETGCCAVCFNEPLPKGPAVEALDRQANYEREQRLTDGEAW